MREQLLIHDQGRERLRLRGGDDAFNAGFCGGCALVVLVLSGACVSSLGPNEYGLWSNFLSGAVSTQVERGGIHLTGPFQGFQRFPATQVTLRWGADGSDRGVINTRTGADPNDPDSGGQPVGITCALQFKFIPSQLKQVYMAFASYPAAKERFLLLAGNMISNTAQDFTPQAFWQERRRVSETMLESINGTLAQQGAYAVRFEMMRIDFAAAFESSITAAQVAEQQRVVNEYEQQVQRVVQDINVLQAQNLATIANISAGAQADAKEIRAGAMRDAFHLKQAMKARKYKELQVALDFGVSHMQEYFKIKSVMGRSNHTVVGLPNVGSASAHRSEL